MAEFTKSFAESELENTVSFKTVFQLDFNSFSGGNLLSIDWLPNDKNNCQYYNGSLVYVYNEFVIYYGLANY